MLNTNPNMKIIEDKRLVDGWITAIIHGRWVQAKVYSEPSEYGVNNCRVSKLAIGKSMFRDKTRDFFPQMAYNYDRGLDFNHLNDDELLQNILKTLNELPTDEQYTRQTA